MQPRARPSSSRPSDSRPSDSRPSGSRPSGSQPSGSQPSGSQPASLLESARESLRLVQIDPGRAVQLATAIGARARHEGDHAAASVAERALGLAAANVKDLSVAVDHLHAAISHARRAGSAELAAEARMTLAGALMRLGRFRRALTEIELALASLHTEAHARALAQRAAILHQLGRLDEALADYRVALVTLRRAEDLVWVQRVLFNRGLLYAFRHAYGPACRDLYEAERLGNELGLTLSAAIVQENLTLVHRRLGDVPTALGHLEAAERLYRSLDAPLGSVLVERSELLLSVRLFAEAREAAEQAVADLVHTRRLSVPEARLVLARAAMLEGDADLAAREARRAVREFTRQRRYEWVALARCTVIFARVAGEGASRVGVRRLAQAAEEAAMAGWPATALEMRLIAGQVGLAGPDRAEGLRQLERVSSARQRGPAARRAKAWFATALLRQAAGQRAGATAAAARGLGILDEYRGTMAATDLRARISGLGVELAQLGLRNALAAGSARDVLRWAELGRARHLLERPVRPPADPELAQLLAELRSAVAEARERRQTGRPTAKLERRQVAIERAIREATRRQRGGQWTPSGAVPKPGELGAALGDAAMVEYIVLDDVVHAVCVVGGRARLHLLGPLQPVAEQVRWLPFALRRLSRLQTGGRSQAGAVTLVRDVAEQLDGLLLRPLRDQIGGRPLVLVPTGALQSMPWSLLPSLTGRPVTVAPSAALWNTTTRHTAAAGHVLVVAGPGLPGADEEACAVAGIYGVAPLVGAEATVARVTAALRGAALVHVAAHGSVRAENPLFSSLRLADGPLTIYDLETLDHGADTVVLAACESGRSVVLAGDELLGLATAFLSRGTRRVVASVVPVPDADTAPLMVAFHQWIAGGSSVAQALAQAQAGMDRAEPSAFAAAAGFVCIGDGLGMSAGRLPLPLSGSVAEPERVQS